MSFIQELRASSTLKAPIFVPTVFWFYKLGN
ncbi:choline/carnitine/betaine transporter [Actinobacillus lignieresii]|uniref:Choline/carnitine/betaine transporter n=1 Tax=Actinobacillus lignieresii TaxID=720 RepID=A0A380TUM9_ACTLI|nr:choline/carnitine/betaine transporter [Actinobacillus lignieresii]